MKQSIKIAFFDTKPYDTQSFDNINKDYNYSLKFYNPRLTIDTVSLTKGFDAICIFVNDILNKEIIEKLVQNKIKLIALRCAGYNNIDLKSVYKKIHVVRVPAYSPYSVAEHAVGLMLSLNRKIHKAYYRTRDNNFSINGFLGFDMFEKTAGIIGMGKIGKILANILKGFGMKILAFDRYPDNEYARKSGIIYTDLETIYRDADIISLHCPLNKETYHIINEKSISRMKDGVMIINTGRGQLINTKALIEGLKNSKIGSAGLDVYEEESEYFFEDFSTENIRDDILARLLTFNNVLVTSHQAFFTKEALANIAGTTLENIKQYLQNKRLENEICYHCGDNKCKRKENGKCF